MFRVLYNVFQYTMSFSAGSRNETIYAAYLSITIHCCAGGWSGNVGAIGTRGLMLTAYEMMFDLPARRIQACWYSIHSTASAAHRAALDGMIDLPI